MKKIYYLSTCDTCKRILSELDAPSDFDLQDIKSDPLTKEEVEQLKSLAGNYESLFSKRARLYKERDLKNKELKEEDYKTLLLEHYTFLKRPVIVHEQEIFIGNSKKTVEAAKASLHE
ncbi:arsenate reductase [Salinimicrobium marinum]|uniref:Arsenate reductase n=1 Tax=Salinimicrobium marinum TaxID=680283 RepID=A0A918SEG5_9FLAO|nr:ArsC/Spx/MgsR family protein [Salinimicrobium marinum]GHA36277.1 arsenate reductase [Salinimicrobium marinum]